MGLQAGRLASRSRGVLQLQRLPLLLLLLLSSGAREAVAQGDTEVPTLYLWKTGKWDRVVLFFYLQIWDYDLERARGFLKDPLCFQLVLIMPGSSGQKYDPCKRIRSCPMPLEKNNITKRQQ